MADTIFDLVIVGGGPAGYTCAIRAAQYGLKVALIEKTDKLGGTCLHWGCIPTKTMLFSAEIWDHLKHAGNYGIDGVDAPKLNWDNLIKRKNDVTIKHAKGLDFLMKKNKITVFNGHGRLTGRRRRASSASTCRMKTRASRRTRRRRGSPGRA